LDDDEGRDSVDRIAESIVARSVTCLNTKSPLVPAFAKAGITKPRLFAVTRQAREHALVARSLFDHHHSRNDVLVDLVPFSHVLQNAARRVNNLDDEEIDDPIVEE
jgi:hypothetical protein